MRTRRPAPAAETGFTLIEMMIALLIFAIISAAGVMLLRGTLDTQIRSDARLDGLQEMQRLRAVLSQDIGQMATRPWRDAQGTARPAFVEGGDAGIMTFVRHGWSNDAGDPRSSLQRVSYRIAGGRLERTASAYVDGAASGRVSRLASDIERVELRARGDDGSWSASWRGARPQDLPRAVELTLHRRNMAPLRMLFAVGVSAAPPPMLPSTMPEVPGVTS